MGRQYDFGKQGEDKAVSYLENEGYTILERNWRLNHLELDIVCTRDQLLVVVEVKTRSLREEQPDELLDLKKRNNLRRAADAYIRMKRIRMEVRFDLILVVGKNFEIEHIRDAVQVFE